MWLDALITNADRSWRNPNMLVWHRALQLIDHGAALTFHHSWAPGRADQVQRFATRAYDVADHALLECAPDVAAADAELGDVDWADVIARAVAAVPDEWLVADSAAWGGPEAVQGGLPRVPDGPHRRATHVGPGSSSRPSSGAGPR